jgi:hypothetical protein
MKFSKWVGVAMALLVIGSCLLPWVYIEPINSTVTGVSAPGTNFGKPGLMNIIVSVLAIFLFLIQRVWAKRTNIFLCAFNLAWTARNFIIIPACAAGDCPTKKIGIFLVALFSIFMMVAALFPDMNIEEKK